MGAMLSSTQQQEPRTPPQSGLTEYALRKAAAEKGCDVGHGQFAGYLRWGLLPDPENGRWSPMTVDRLIEIGNAGKRARRLERRAVLLGVPNPEKRRKAMVALARIMKAPKLKVRRLQRAAAKLEAQPAPTDVYGNPVYWRPQPPKTWRLPEPSSWPSVLNDPLTRERFEWISLAAYYSAEALLVHEEELDDVLKRIPREEVVLLLVIQELSMHQHMLRETIRNQKKKG
ncbi:MAG TPA: hypothetical protein VHG53_00170 [Candidatus Limnocylindria bacterium]|nr:hypothetical protein [Candidatus Limnocylindria bacterium]